MAHQISPKELLNVFIRPECKGPNGTVYQYTLQDLIDNSIHEGLMPTAHYENERKRAAEIFLADLAAKGYAIVRSE